MNVVSTWLKSRESFTFNHVRYIRKYQKDENDPLAFAWELAKTFESYEKVCADGDYEDGSITTGVGRSFKIGQALGAYLYTDRLGFVIGYILITESEPSEVTSVKCYKDTRAIMGAAANDFDKFFETLVEVECVVTPEEGSFVYTFIDAPEETAYIFETSYRYTTDMNRPFSINVIDGVKSFQQRLEDPNSAQYIEWKKGMFVNSRVEKAFFELGENGGGAKVFVLLNAKKGNHWIFARGNLRETAKNGGLKGSARKTVK